VEMVGVECLVRGGKSLGRQGGREVVRVRDQRVVHLFLWL
jgi:hypothetical protein